MKLLTPRVHGYFDYTFVVALIAAPILLRFGPVASTIAYVVAAAHLAVSLLTNYPLSAAKVIPSPVHAIIEFATGVGLMAAPWLFGFSDSPSARSFYVVSGLLLVGVALSTSTAKPSTRPERYDRYQP